MNYVLSILPSFCPSNRKFLGDWLISFFLKLSVVLEVQVVLCVTEPDFFKTIFALKMEKMGQKFDLLNLLENLMINFF